MKVKGRKKANASVASCMAPCKSAYYYYYRYYYVINVKKTAVYTVVNG